MNAALCRRVRQGTDPCIRLRRHKGRCEFAPLPRPECTCDPRFTPDDPDEPCICGGTR